MRILKQGRKSTLALMLVAISTATCQAGETPATSLPPTPEPPVVEIQPEIKAEVETEGEDEPLPTSEADQAPSADRYTLAIVPEETEARYIVEEEFFGQGFATAIGVTNIVAGEVTFIGSETPLIESGEFRVDISTLTSDEGRRDNAIRQRWLQSSLFPQAIFRPAEVAGLPAGFSFVEGETIQFTLTGEMTIRDVTQDLSFSIEAVGSGDRLTGRATATFLMTDFGFNPPSIVGVLEAENVVVVELDFTLVQV
jgi:polyisoprenoid-binding protein YceI